ncbi:putative sugar phosphatases of the HAD superfamily [Rubellimicrobium thermophilum DSM 16684]|uniref:Putative sugar phosphatases of the HAD superfamily n=1 Tax=Rubellimicrobium thermophilum DSM 16684 TaxID=1123069 RepID=S9R1Q8_9RHOB|nr:putative sugar phosphatases of the HAD superfamily [Rubellimicrobium thermophilum DSM 16684]
MSDVSLDAGPGDMLSDAPSAFARYEAIRPRLPVARYPAQSLHLSSLDEVADQVDGFLLDAFGVLNVGETAIPGAVARMASLRRRGKRLAVLTNAASYTRDQLLAKYHRLGFDFTADEVVASRDVAVARLEAIAPGATWAAIAAAGDTFADIPAHLVDALADPAAFDRADAILFLSTARWSPALQRRLALALDRRPRPLVIANPDLVAPREGGLTLEPGLFGHDLLDALPGLEVHWFGKPFPEAFAEGIARTGLAPDRLAMVGDTLHTDVLGGAAAGCRSVLVTDHGLFAGRATAPFIAASGIVPDFIVPSP